MSVDPPKMPFLADLAGCVRFFSRLPLPRLGAWDDPAKIPDFSRAARALPLAGLVIAAPALVVILLLHWRDAPALIAAFIYVGLLVVAGGGLHEDGLADMADGFGGGATRQKKLDIMKDSRIGAYGVLALILAVGLKIAALAHLYSALPLGAFAAMLILAVTASRFVMLFLWHGLANARPGGLADKAGRPGRRAVDIGGGLVLIVLVLCAPALAPHALAGLASCIVLTIALVGSTAQRHIGGQTGDVLGAGQQIAETAILTVLALTTT